VTDPFVPWLPRHAGTPGAVRLAVKDVIDVGGLPTGAGHPTWLATHEPATADAACVAALVRAHASVVGKVHTDELAYSVFGTNAHYGAPDNPAAPGHLTGGSSSGCAAAVAAGLAELGLGTDTAGSVRVPAAWCGLYGLRPSHSRVSRAGVVALAPSFDVPGLLAVDLPTLRAGAAALLGDAPAPPDEPAGPPRHLRAPADLWQLADPDVVHALQPALRALGDLLPIRTEPLFAPAAPDYPTAFAVRQGWEFWQHHGAWITAHRPVFGPGVTARVTAAAARTRAEVTRAAKVLDDTRQALAGALAGAGVLVVPTVPAPAPARSTGAGAPGAPAQLRGRLLALTTPASIAGLPALSVPAGTVDGRPVGICLIGSPGTDEHLLDLAAGIAR
jgi:amidase